MIDFPNSPTVGQVVTAPNGTAWRWTGSTWLLGTGASAGGARGRVAYAQSTANQAAITTVTDIVGLSATWTADPSRTYRTTVFASVLSSVSGDAVGIYIFDGSGSSKQANWDILNLATISQTQIMSVVETGLSGSVTRKARIERVLGTGTFTVVAGPTYPAFILVEDITYEAGTSGSSLVPTKSVAYAAPSVTVGSFPAGGYTYPVAGPENIGPWISPAATTMLPGGVTAWDGLWTVTATFVSNPSSTGGLSLYLEMGSASNVFATTTALVFACASVTAEQVLPAGSTIKWRMYKDAATPSFSASTIRFVLAYTPL